MIHFWTDRRPGESDILAAVKHETLVVATIEGASLCRSAAPAGGWTHELLQEKAQGLATLTGNGANARLGHRLVGSTET